MQIRKLLIVIFVSLHRVLNRAASASLGTAIRLRFKSLERKRKHSV